MTSFTTGASAEPGAFAPFELDRSLAFVHPVLKLGYEHWVMITADRDMPDRRDVDPRAFGGHLSHLNLFNIERDGTKVKDLLPRVVGGEFERVFGDLLKGPVSMLLPPFIFERWQTIVEGMLEAGGPVRLTGHVAYEGMEHLAGEMLVAPLSDGEEKFSVLYVVAVFEGSNPNRH